MKRFSSVIVALFMFASVSFAQNASYVSTMESTIKSFENARTLDEISASTATFERINSAEPNAWLPAYWASFANMNLSFLEKDLAKKDAFLDKAEKLCQHASKLQPKNDEIAVLKANIANARMAVDPATRWEKYGELVKVNAREAKSINPENPRLQLLEAQTIFYTPAEYGGGKQKAIPAVKESIVKFEKFKPESNIHPNWGEKRAKLMLAECEKEGK
ncbi:MAG: hypothetical protein U5M51_04780 [Emticicia sp.]|nr:hypothetical protein [Emticicia sp.]